MTSVMVGETEMWVPKCAIEFADELFKNYYFCTSETWDLLTSRLRDMKLWPSKTLFTKRSMMLTEEILENPDWSYRLDWSIHWLNAMSPRLLDMCDNDIRVVQVMFGYNFDRNPSWQTASEMLGEVDKKQYLYLHFGFLATMVLDSPIVEFDIDIEKKTCHDLEGREVDLSQYTY